MESLHIDSISVGDERCNVIMWMDHRAVAEAETINRTRHPVLRSVGGSVSLEMQLPKLLWLKKVSITDNNLPGKLLNFGIKMDKENLEKS